MEQLIEARLSRWLALIEGPEGREGRRRAVEEMRAVGTDTVLPLLAARLSDPDMEVRCRAILAILLVDAGRGIELVLPMLRDPEATVRWQACGCLHDFGDERTVGPLTAVLAGDPDPQVRGTAAYALGGVGSPASIPALLLALDSDHEPDEMGDSPSWCAATALDDILGAHETRIREPDGLCHMRPGKPDLDRLRRLATELYQQWTASRP